MLRTEVVLSSGFTLSVLCSLSESNSYGFFIVFGFWADFALEWFSSRFLHDSSSKVFQYDLEVVQVVCFSISRVSFTHLDIH